MILLFAINLPHWLLFGRAPFLSFLSEKSFVRKLSKGSLVISEPSEHMLQKGTSYILPVPGMERRQFSEPSVKGGIFFEPIVNSLYSVYWGGGDCSVW